MALPKHTARANGLLFLIKDGASAPRPALSGPRPCHRAGATHAGPTEMNRSGCKPNAAPGTQLRASEEESAPAKGRYTQRKACLK